MIKICTNLTQIEELNLLKNAKQYLYFVRLTCKMPLKNWESWFLMLAKKGF
jgi:hypothetical protein